MANHSPTMMIHWIPVDLTLEERLWHWQGSRLWTRPSSDFCATTQMSKRCMHWWRNEQEHAGKYKRAKCMFWCFGKTAEGYVDHLAWQFFTRAQWEPIRQTRSDNNYKIHFLPHKLGRRVSVEGGLFCAQEAFCAEEWVKECWVNIFVLGGSRYKEECWCRHLVAGNCGLSTAAAALCHHLLCILVCRLVCQLVCRLAHTFITSCLPCVRTFCLKVV